MARQVRITPWTGILSDYQISIPILIIEKEILMKKFIPVLLLMLFFYGCAATQTALTKKDLKVGSKMSESIFLEVENQTEKSVYIDIRNTSDKDIDLLPIITGIIQRKNYRIVNNAKSAFYILQANVLFVGETNQTALEQSLYSGYGGAVLGAAAGGAIANARNGNIATGAVIGGLLGAGAEMVTGSLTKDVTFSIITDIQISEKTSEKVSQSTQSQLRQGKSSSVSQSSQTTTNRKKYQTRIASTANQVNLKFEEALPALQEGMAKSIAGIF